MTIGEKIKSIRKEKKLTLRELASKTDISPSFISDIENNRSNPSLNRLKDIANALNTSVSYLLGECEKQYDGIPHKIREAISNNPKLLELCKHLFLRKDLQLMIKQTKDLNSETVHQIIDIIKVIKNKEHK
ncbi:helix-turn-helix domain-containing protein [Selenihalanaerobacter shriftii]|uniref:Helix-turn-helix domain-containing protein n=1 Tax=Selenihalanaerobacter shriftii TaxID=142842 RepID=A0A1T4NDZ6_9FIRM|nr:helix-turn-helix transcriptional regulator [Selenihalanaerobacter shriftii]SJZ77490.1 Helix-turn-helix domain-containing protein [Selenihalanaerobacter shriftii]